MWLAFVAHVIVLTSAAVFLYNTLSLDISLTRLDCKYLREGLYLVGLYIPCAQSSSWPIVSISVEVPAFFAFLSRNESRVEGSTALWWYYFGV